MDARVTWSVLSVCARLFWSLPGAGLNNPYGSLPTWDSLWLCVFLCGWRLQLLHNGVELFIICTTSFQLNVLGCAVLSVRGIEQKEVNCPFQTWVVERIVCLICLMAMCEVVELLFWKRRMVLDRQQPFLAGGTATWNFAYWRNLFTIWSVFFFFFFPSLSWNKLPAILCGLQVSRLPFTRSDSYSLPDSWGLHLKCCRRGRALQWSWQSYSGYLLHLQAAASPFVWTTENGIPGALMWVGLPIIEKKRKLQRL